MKYNIIIGFIIGSMVVYGVLKIVSTIQNISNLSQVY